MHCVFEIGVSLKKAMALAATALKKEKPWELFRSTHGCFGLFYLTKASSATGRPMQNRYKTGNHIYCCLQSVFCPSWKTPSF